MFTPPLQDIRALISNDPSCIMNWNQTDEVCKQALKCEPKCLAFIREQTEELVLFTAYWSYSHYTSFNIFSYLHTINDDLTMKILKVFPQAIEFIENQTEEQCWIAISNNKYLFKYIKNKTDDMCYYCLQQYPHLIQHIENPSIELQKIALAQSVQVYPLIKNPDNSITQLMLIMYPCEGLVYIEQTDEIVRKSLKINPSAIQYANKSLLTYDMCLNVVERNSKYFKEIPIEHHSEEMYLIAVKMVSNIKYMINPSTTVIRKALSIDKEETLKYYDGYISGYKPKICVKDIKKSDEIGEEFSLEMYPNRIDPITGEGLMKGCLYGFLPLFIFDNSKEINVENSRMELVGKYEDIRDFIKNGKNGSTGIDVFAPYSTNKARNYLVPIGSIIWIEY